MWTRWPKKASGRESKKAGRWIRDEPVLSAREAQFRARSTGPIRWDTHMGAGRQVNGPPSTVGLPARAGSGDVLGIGRGLNRLHVCLFRPAWLAGGGSYQRLSDTVDGFPERRKRSQGQREQRWHPSHDISERPPLGAGRNACQGSGADDEEGGSKLAFPMLYESVCSGSCDMAVGFHATAGH